MEITLNAFREMQLTTGFVHPDESVPTEPLYVKLKPFTGLDAARMYNVTIKGRFTEEYLLEKAIKNEPKTNESFDLGITSEQTLIMFMSDGCPVSYNEFLTLWEKEPSKVLIVQRGGKYMGWVINLRKFKKMKNVISTFRFPVKVAGTVYSRSVSPLNVGDELPNQLDGVTLLVNAMFFNANKHRKDLCMLDPENVTRDELERAVEYQGFLFM
jgi:hypothetical protein